MATRSAEKAHRQSLKRHLRNRAVKRATKTAFKKANAAILSHDINAARDAVRAAIIALDKAAQKGVLHANNSARHKSRLLIKYNATIAVLQTPSAEAEAPKKKPSRKAAAEATARAPKRAAARKPAAKKTTKK
ncbi:MAG: 30S ribosomal protein S20 [Chloroflexota bacterium]